MVLLQRKLYFSSPTFSRGGTTFSGGGGGPNAYFDRNPYNL